MEFILNFFVLNKLNFNWFLQDDDKDEVEMIKNEHCDDDEDYKQLIQR